MFFRKCLWWPVTWHVDRLVHGVLLRWPIGAIACAFVASPTAQAPLSPQDGHFQTGGCAPRAGTTRDAPPVETD